MSPLHNNNFNIQPLFSCSFLHCGMSTDFLKYASCITHMSRTGQLPLAKLIVEVLNYPCLVLIEALIVFPLSFLF